MNVDVSIQPNNRDHRDEPTYWFAVLEIARERGDFEGAVKAKRQLLRLGVRISDVTDTLSVLRHLTLAEVEQRLADVDAERAALSLLRRSLAARERVRRRSEQRATLSTKGALRLP